MLHLQELVEQKWTKKKWAGPLQYEDKSGKLMMLPTDMALIVGKKGGWHTTGCGWICVDRFLLFSLLFPRTS